MAAEVASKLNWTHDALADHLCAAPPPHPGATEATRIRQAWRFLEPRVDLLATVPDADTIADELADLHHEIRSGLGHTRARVLLQGVPCMSCGTAALTLIDGDRVECGDCGENISEELFGLLARHAIDAVIDAYDAANTPPQRTVVA